MAAAPQAQGIAWAREAAKLRHPAMKRELDCQEVSRLISAGLDSQLPPDERAMLRWHFVICSACRHVDAQMRFLQMAMRALGGRALGGDLGPSDAEAGPKTDADPPNDGGSR